MDLSARDRSTICPYCSYRVMSAATLCLSCWRKLDPERRS
jgi:DNA-directed RNA polymerase subunit RPC12/RpoP